MEFNKYTVIAFDLSSVCVGVVAALLENKKIRTVKSCPIIPKEFDASVLGFMKSKKKLPNKSGTKHFNTWYKKGERYISEIDKKKRDVLVRTAKDSYVLKYIGEQITKIVDKLKPSLIVVEKNEIFNGVLTSILLGKIMGVLTGICASKGIKIIEIKVKQARSILDLTKITHDLVDNLSEDEILKIPDITKRALRKYMEKKYGHLGLKCSTDDESDACVVFNYWYEEILIKIYLKEGKIK